MAEYAHQDMEQFSMLLRMAEEQQILPLVAYTLCHTPALACPHEIRREMPERLLKYSAANLVKQQRIFCLLDDLQQHGFSIRMLKGYAVAKCYACPECRGSADTDVLVEPAQEKALVRFLRQKGFQSLPRGLTSHHTVCAHPQYGKVELHTSLYSELVEDVWFQNLTEKAIIREESLRMTTPDGSCLTLGHTDHLIFLALHLAKHFIQSGMSVKMMLDVAVYFGQNRRWIDADRFWNTMNQLHYAKLLNGVLQAMITCCGFSADAFPGRENVPKEAVEALLLDLLKGGYMGEKEEEQRRESSMEYNRRVFQKQKGKCWYKLYMTAWKLRGSASSIFLGKEQLTRLYPAMAARPWLLPCVWLYHIVSYSMKKIGDGVLHKDIRTEDAEMTQAAASRIVLFEQLGML